MYNRKIDMGECKNADTIYNGDIYIAKLPVKTAEHIQDGIRPVIIVSNDKANKYSPVITVIPMTGNLDKKPLPTHVNVNHCGLSRNSIALVEQITSINKSCLISKIGDIRRNKRVRSDIKRAMLVQLDMDS